MAKRYNERILKRALMRNVASMPVVGTTEVQLRGPGVYVVGFGDYVKIGVSSRLLDRIQELQNVLPDQLVIYALLQGDRYEERKLHSIFRRYRTRGEWFKNVGELRDWIDAGCPADLTIAAPLQIINQLPNEGRDTTSG